MKNNSPYSLASFFALGASLLLAMGTAALGLTAEEQLRFADGIYLRGLYESALAEYVAFVREFPDSSSADAAYYRIGECYRQVGNRAGADRFYAKVANEFPVSPFAARAALRRAEIATADERYGDAVDIASALVKANDDGSAPFASPDDLASALYSLASAQTRLGHPELAGDAFKRILQETPKSPYAAYAALDLASLQAPRATSKNAIAQVDAWFQQAADSAASASAKAEALFRHGEWRYSRQEWRDAADIFQQLLVEFPDSPRAPAATLAAGWALLHLDDAAAALPVAEAAIAAATDAPSHAAALYLRANAFRALGRSGEALADYNAILATHADAPSAPFAAFELMTLHFANRDFEKTLSNLPPNPLPEQLPDILWMRAEAENALARTDLARGHYRELADKYPDAPQAPDALMRLGELSRADGRAGEAADLFRDVATRYPAASAAPAALRASALLRLDAGAPDEALADYDALLALAQPPPTEVLADARLQRALCLIRAGRSAEAEPALADLLAETDLPAAIRPRALYWHASLAAAAEPPRPAEAEREFRACLAAGPDAGTESLARLGLVLALQAQDRADEAADQAALLLDSPESIAAHPSLIEWLTRHRLDQNRLRDAATAARALATHSTDASWRQIACLHLGQAFEQLERADDARAAYAAAIAQPAATREGAEARLRLAALELAAGESASAARRFADAAEAATADTDLDLRVRAYYGLAQAAEAQHDLPSAVRHYMSVAVLFDDPEWSPLALSNAIRLYDANGQTAARDAAIRDLRTRYPDSSFARQLPPEWATAAENAAADLATP